MGSAYLEVQLSKTGDNTATNTSTVWCGVYLIWNGMTGWNAYPNGTSGSLTIDGNTYTFTKPFNTGNSYSGRIQLYSNTFTVAHSAGQAKYVSASASFDTGIRIYGWGVHTGSNAITLPALVTASQFTMGSSNPQIDGEKLRLTVESAIQGLSYTVSFTAGGHTHTNWIKSQSLVFDYTFTSAYWAKYFGNKSELPLTVSIATYSGDTHIGTVTRQGTLQLNQATTQPAIKSVQVTDLNTSWYTKHNTHIQGQSYFKIIINAEGKYGAKIDKVTTHIGGKTYVGSNITTEKITSTGNVNILVTVTDSRGIKTTHSQQINVAAYHAPRCSNLYTTRCNSSGTPKENGQYAKVEFDLDIASLAGANTKSYVVQYRKSGETNWQTMKSGTPSTYVKKESVVSTSAILNLDYAYEFRVGVTDFFGTVYFSATPAPTEAVVFDVHRTGKGLEVGGVCNGEGFGVSWEFVARKGIKFTNDRNEVVAIMKVSEDGNTLEIKPAGAGKKVTVQNA